MLAGYALVLALLPHSPAPRLAARLVTATPLRMAENLRNAPRDGTLTDEAETDACVDEV